MLGESRLLVRRQCTNKMTAREYLRSRRLKCYDVPRALPSLPSVAVGCSTSVNSYVRREYMRVLCILYFDICSPHITATSVAVSALRNKPDVSLNALHYIAQYKEIQRYRQAQRTFQKAIRNATPLYANSPMTENRWV